MRMRLLVVAVFCVCMLSADVMYEMTVTTTTTSTLLKDTEMNHRVFIKDDAARVEETIVQPDSSEHVRIMIYRFDRGVIWTIDMDNKQYTETVLSDTDQDLGDMLELEPLFENPDVSINETGARKKIVGKDCKEVIITKAETSDSLDLEISTTLWVTQELDSCEEFVAFYRKIEALYDPLSYPEDSIEQTITARLPGEMHEVEGFILQSSRQMTISRCGLSICMRLESVFTKFDDKPITQMVFEIPPGFTLHE